MSTDKKKFDEGLDHIRNAEKSLKTSFLKWRPDYDLAGDEYAKAATCFRNAKSFQQCKECLLKAADCHKQNRSLFHAAKSIEQAVLVCKELGDLRDVGTLAEKACSLYQQQGSPDSGSACLDKAAKIIEQTNPEEALRLYTRAAEVSVIEDSARQAAEYISKTARILVKLQKYDQAAYAIKREIGYHLESNNLPAIGRLAVALVLVQLARGDAVAAEKAFKEWGNCCEQPEIQTLEILLAAFDQEDPEAARKALNSSFIKHMDVEYARLARDIKLPEESLIGVPKATVLENVAPTYVSEKGAGTSDAQNFDIEDEDGGLC